MPNIQSEVKENIVIHQTGSEILNPPVMPSKANHCMLIIHFKLEWSPAGNSW